MSLNLDRSNLIFKRNLHGSPYKVSPFRDEGSKVRESQCNIQVLGWSFGKPSHRPGSIHFQSLYCFEGNQTFGLLSCHHEIFQRYRKAQTALLIDTHIQNAQVQQRWSVLVAVPGLFEKM